MTDKWTVRTSITASSVSGRRFPFIVSVIGSRDYAHLSDVDRVVSVLPLSVVVLSGGARGVDSRATDTARYRGMTTYIAPAMWKRFGKGAGMMRNHDVVRNADLVVAFWDGVSTGTNASIAIAVQYGIPKLVKLPDENVDVFVSLVVDRLKNIMA